MRRIYRKFLKPIGEKPIGVPLEYINEKPFHFLTWAVVAIVLGLSGVWLPTLLAYVRGKNAIDVLMNCVNGGGLAAFSVVLLADGIASAMVADKVDTSSSRTATGVRGFISSLAILVVVVQVGVMGIVQAVTDSAYPSYNFQVIVTAIAIFLACYLYCFRSDKWPELIEFAAEAAKKEAVEVKDISETAATITKDKDGNKV
jgi:hypothetical protein